MPDDDSADDSADHSPNEAPGAAERGRRGGGRRARKERREHDAKTGAGGVPFPSQGWPGGWLKPLTDSDARRIHESALHVLATVGMGVIGDMPDGAKALLANGATLNDHGRLCFTRAFIEDTLAATCRTWTLHGQDETRSLEISPKGVHYGTAGGAVMILDFETGRYRETTLADLYDAARLIDTLANIHWCYRPLIARDMETREALDVNTAYALACGTTKPLGVTFSAPETVGRVVEMFDVILGGEGRFKKTPICHSVQGDGVPPLRYAEDRCRIKEACIRAGVPIMIASAPQAGATSPAALAGSLVQVVAEALAGVAYANAVSPGHPLCFAPWPFVADLRTGAMTGGSGEQALLMAAVAQMGAFYDLPTSVAAGMADSKLPDAQSGYEKAYTTAMAGLAGAGMIHESAGMHASLLGCALESFVVDDDMLGSILRTVRGIEVSDATLSLDAIARVNLGGPGHYLGDDQTLALMESEYAYPPLSDRQTPGAWEDDGSRDMRERARAYTAETLAAHYPGHVDDALDAAIRAEFDIHLPRETMQAGGGRW